jgi:integrative and conjugative element protein (TIGR02256 family)
MSEWVLDLKQYGRMRFTEKLIRNLKEYRQNDDITPESGGILIGSFLSSGGKLLIDKFTPPQISDRQGRNSYFRSKSHQLLAEKIWEETDHKSTFVGLWHTHPEAIPNFSEIDKQDWMNTLNQASYQGQNLIFIIVGTTHIRCWLGTKKMVKNKLKLIGELRIE